jgi:methyl-accepting chemotaxis protein
MKNIKISVKLISYFLIIAIVSVGIIGTRAYLVSKDAIENRIEQQLTSIRDIQANRISEYLDERVNDLQMLTYSEGVYQMFLRLESYHNQLGVKHNDPFPVGTNRYDTLISRYEGLFNRYAETYEYYDIFMVCKAHGHVIYTTAKEDDLGTNLEHGKYKTTALADLWKKVVETESVAVEDYEPYAPSGGRQAMFMGLPVKKDGRFLAVLIVQLSEKPADEILNQRTGLGNTGESFLIGKHENKIELKNNRILKKQTVGTKLTDTIFEYSLNTRQPSYTSRTDQSGKTHYYTFAPISSELVNWGVVVDITEKEVLQPVYTMRNRIIIISLIILVILVFAAIYTARSFTKPIEKTVAFAKKITNGDYDAEVDVNQKDEIGVLVNALREMVEVFKQGYHSAKEVAAGNLYSLREKDTTEIKKGTLEESLFNMREKLKEVVGTVKSIAESVAGGSNQISNSSVQIAQGANEQAAAAEEISSSMEEMSATIEQNTDNAKKTKEVSLEAVRNIRTSQKSFEETLSAVENIIKKISIVTEIAEKTDVLAINVAIEAARAGEHGKGFDVLAVEVRKLAELSKNAASEINVISKQTIESSKTSGKLLKELVPDIEETAKLIGEIAKSGEEQLRGSTQISEAVNQLSEVTQENSSASEEMSSGSEELTAQAEELKNAVAYFKLEKDK